MLGRSSRRHRLPWWAWRHAGGRMPLWRPATHLPAERRRFHGNRSDVTTTARWLPVLRTLSRCRRNESISRFPTLSRQRYVIVFALITWSRAGHVTDWLRCWLHGLRSAILHSISTSLQNYNTRVSKISTPGVVTVTSSSSSPSAKIQFI